MREAYPFENQQPIGPPTGYLPDYLCECHWEATGGKRGRGADRKEPFVAAGQVSEEGRPERLWLSPVRGFRLKKLETWARRHLQPGTVVRSDGLHCFRGGGKGSCATPGLTWVNTLLGNVKRAIDGTYHACDSRYAGRYLAEFAYRFNRHYQLADLVPRLAYVAARTPPPPQRPLTVAGTAGQSRRRLNMGEQ